MLEAVTFDLWHTILEESLGEMRGRQVDGFARILAEAGHPTSRDAIRAAFARSWSRFEERWAANEGPYTHVHAARDIVEDLGVPPADGLPDRLAAAFDEVGLATPFRVAPGIGSCLDALRVAGLRLGLVCDVGMIGASVLRKRLDREGLLARFEALGFSDETGWYKPAAGAFLPVLGALGVGDPGRAAHVGDRRETDVAGARALGMIAVRYTGFRDDEGDGPEADVVVASHEALPAALGLDR